MVGWLSVAWAAPSPELPCDQIARRLEAEPLPERPAVPVFWWLEKNPCGNGRFGGPLPPEAQEVWCVDGLGRRTGRSTMLSRELYVLRETRFTSGREVGPRIEWNPVTKRATAWTEFDDDLPHGRAVEWTDTGPLVTWLKKGVKDGPSYKIDARGRLELVTYFVDGDRSTRTCVWRDEKLAIDSR